MKAREHRQTVKVTARMKASVGWQDVAIHNVSRRGMRITVAEPPRRGAVIEVRRATQIIVARAVWVRGNDCGLRTQDPIDIPALIDPNAHKAQAVIDAAQKDRRAPGRRAAETAQRSAAYGRAVQAGAVGLFILAAAIWLASLAFDMLSAPLDDVRAAMGGGGGGVVEASAD